MPGTATVTPKHLLKEGTPAELREAIVPEDRAAFDEQYRAALDAAAQTLSLGALESFLAHWRPRAAHQVHMGHDKWHAIVAEGERRLAGGAPPPGMASEEEVEELLRAKLAAR